MRLERGMAIFKVESASISKQNTLLLASRCGEEGQALDGCGHHCFIWNMKSRLLPEEVFFLSELLG